MCLYPKLIDNPKYRKNKKNGGNIPPVSDKRVLLVPVGCGKCMECIKMKQREWTVRLLEEFRTDPQCKFITLSFSEDSLIKLEDLLKVKVPTGIRKTITMKNGKTRNYYNYEEKKLYHKLTGYNLDNALAKKGMRLFLERWRKKYGKSVKHWFVSELGTKNTERIHLHGILFTDKTKQEIEDRWQYGNLWEGDYVNEGTIKYCCKYLAKPDIVHKEYKPIVLTSDGIGANYIKRLDSKINAFNGKDTKQYYRSRERFKMALPIYYRNALYTEAQREELWLHKLDEQVRYVDGVKIDVSKTDKHYYLKLFEARKLNKQLGYGDDTINWERRKYENERRSLIKRRRYAVQKKR